MIYAYASTNLLTGLAAAAFTWSAGLNDSTRSRLNDGKMSEPYFNGNAASGINVIIDFGAAVSPSGFAVCNSNAAVLKANATLKIESADDAAFTVNAIVDKAATTLNSALFFNKDHVVQFPAHSPGSERRYWRLTWTWTGTVTAFQIGELWAFSQAQLARRAIYGDGESRTFKTTEVEYYNGSTRAYLLAKGLRSLRLPFTDLTQTELEALYTMQAASNGGASPFLWINSYEATAVAAANAEQEVIYGRIASPEFTFTIPDFNLFSTSDILIKSLGREIGA